jgi:glutamine amidotransferase
MTVIIDYGLGNPASICNMLKKIGADAIISSQTDDIARAERLILPGVGAFDAGMNNLAERGLVDILRAKVLDERTPILGICLGLQLFGTGSAEGKQPGLGWLEARSVRFQPPPAGPDRVPHMGWNTCQPNRPSSLLDGLEDDSRFYFVHSYHLACRDAQDVVAVTRYGYDFPSVVARGNVYGTQFHPEKSHRFGARLLENFVRTTRC